MVTRTAVRGITTLDPTLGPTPIETRLADRVDTLEGKRVVLLNNCKRNAKELLEYVAEELARSYPRLEVIPADKPNFTRPAPPEQLDDLAAEADVVITAIGD
jgi:predicted GTPase